MRWTVRRNAACLRARGWPVVEAEERYPAEVLLCPVDACPMDGAVFTDGSVIKHGGAAAVQEEEAPMRTARVPSPRSSTHCDLVALIIALELEPTQTLSNSLPALTVLQSWRRWSTRRVLDSMDRVEVRQFWTTLPRS